MFNARSCTVSNAKRSPVVVGKSPVPQVIRVHSTSIEILDIVHQLLEVLRRDQPVTVKIGHLELEINRNPS